MSRILRELQSLPFVFQFQGSQLSTLFMFPINPQSFSLTLPTRGSLTQTMTSNFENFFGAGIPKAQLKGTFGLGYRRQFGLGQLLPGQLQNRLLETVIDAFYHEAQERIRREDGSIKFWDLSDGHILRVRFLDFQYERAITHQFQHKFTINFVVIEDFLNPVLDAGKAILPRLSSPVPGLLSLAPDLLRDFLNDLIRGAGNFLGHFPLGSIPQSIPIDRLADRIGGVGARIMPPGLSRSGAGNLLDRSIQEFDVPGLSRRVPQSVEATELDPRVPGGRSRTLLEHLERFENAKKEVPRLRDVIRQLRTVLGRVYLLQRAIDDFRNDRTAVIAFPFSELQATVDVMDTLISSAFDNMDVPFAFIADVRDVQIRLRGARLLEDLFDSGSRRREAVESVFRTSLRSGTPYKIVQGDTLRGIAVRFVKDGGRWTELVSLNGLDYPYIVDTTAEVPPGKKVLVPGDVITLPLAAKVSGNQVIPQKPSDLASILGTDISVSADGRLTLDPSGDLVPVSGVRNLEQALRGRLLTERGRLPLHPTYGSDIKEVLGQEASRATVAMAGLEAQKSVLEDPRITRVTDGATTFESTVLDVKFSAFVIGQDEPIPQNLVLPL